VSHAVAESAKFDVKRDPATQCEVKVGDTGLEHPPLALSKTPISGEGGAKSGARHAPKQLSDPGLAMIMESWPSLPEHIRAAMKALVLIAREQR